MGITTPSGTGQKDNAQGLNTLVENAAVVQKSYTDLINKAPNTETTLTEFTDALSALAVPLMNGDVDNFVEVITELEEKIGPQSLFSFAGVIPEPFQLQIASLIEQGGPLSSLNLGSGENSARRQEERRKEEDNARAFIAAATASHRAAEAAAKAVSNAFENYDAALMSAYNNYHTTRERLGIEAAANNMADEIINSGLIERAQEDAYNAARQEGQSPENALEIANNAVVAKTKQHAQEQGQINDQAALDILSDEVRARLDTTNLSLQNNQDRSVQVMELGQNLGGSITEYAISIAESAAAGVTSTLAGFSFFSDPNDRSTEITLNTKTELIDYFQSEANAIIESAQDIIEQNERAIDDINQAFTSQMDMTPEKANELNELKDLAQQQIDAAKQQIQFAEQTAPSINAIAPYIPENLNDISPSDIKNIIINIPDEAFEKARIMQAAAGNEDYDPLAFIEPYMDRLKETLDPTEREELENFITDVVSAKQKSAEAEARLEQAAQQEAEAMLNGGSLHDPTFGMSGGMASGVISPIPTAADIMNAAYEDMNAAQKRLQELADSAGVKIEEKITEDGEQDVEEHLTHDMKPDPHAEDVADIVSQILSNPNATEAELDQIIDEYYYGSQATYIKDRVMDELNQLDPKFEFAEPVMVADNSTSATLSAAGGGMNALSEQFAAVNGAAMTPEQLAELEIQRELAANNPNDPAIKITTNMSA